MRRWDPLTDYHDHHGVLNQRESCLVSFTIFASGEEDLAMRLAATSSASHKASIAES